MDRPTIVIAVISVLVLGGIIGVTVNAQRNFTPRTQCVEHSASLSMHIHPLIEINVNGQKFPLPGNIGISPSCMMAIHTHTQEGEDAGKIHVEYPQAMEFKLGDFFANWGQPFSKDQLMEHKVDDSHTLTMTVDGQPSTDYENLVLKDGQRIILNYASK